jgi:hypothetical protein
VLPNQERDGDDASMACAAPAIAPGAAPPVDAPASALDAAGSSIGGTRRSRSLCGTRITRKAAATVTWPSSHIDRCDASPGQRRPSSASNAHTPSPATRQPALASKKRNSGRSPGIMAWHPARQASR